MKYVSFQKLGSILTILACAGCDAGSGFSGLVSAVTGESGNGVGVASVSIQSRSPGVDTVSVNTGESLQFIVSATGSGELSYRWALDNEALSEKRSSFSLSSTDYSIGNHTVTVTVSDKKGSTSTSWNLKINAAPVIQSFLPTATSYQTAVGVPLSFSATVTDPNQDTLTYLWTFDGVPGLLDTEGTQASFTPTDSQIGSHQVKLTVTDGEGSGVLSATQTWNLEINYFNNGCNLLVNTSSPGKSCVFAGKTQSGAGERPDDDPTRFRVLPNDVLPTAAGVFISDDVHNAIWFWNTQAVDSTILGKTFAPGVMGIVAGSTGRGFIGDGGPSTNAMMFSPRHLAFDGSSLFVADTSNNRVRKIASDGTISTVLGGGASNTDGAQANTHVCTSPLGLAVYGSNLYAACNGNHRVKRVDLSTGQAFIFAGSGGNSGAAGDGTPTLAQINSPSGLDVDSSGNLYILEAGGCRVRVVNNTAGNISFYGSVTIGSGNIGTILGNTAANSCTTTYTSPPTSARIQDGFDLTVLSDRIYISSNSTHRIHVVNLTNSALTYGSTTVASYGFARIIGTGTAGFIGDGMAPINTRLNSPWGIGASSTGDVYIADRSNFRVRRLDFSNAQMTLIAGNGQSRNGTFGNTTVGASSDLLSGPRHVVYDESQGVVFFSDQNNQRIRQIDKYGRISTAIGTGTAGGAGTENEIPTNVLVNGPAGLAITQSNLIYTDISNHVVRVWNRGTATLSMSGISILANSVSTVAGDYAAGAGNGTSGTAISAQLNNPEGVATDGTNIFISDTSNHCVKKVDASGTISVVAGTCGTAGSTNGPVGTGRLNNPAGLSYYSRVNGSVTEKGLFIADRGSNQIRFLNLTGSSVILAGSPVNNNEIMRVACGGSFHDDGIQALNSSCSGPYGVVYQPSGNQFCYTSLNYANVRCVNVVSGIVTTVFGQLQGAGSTPSYFGGIPMTSTDQDYISGTTATLNGPLGISTMGSNAILTTDYFGHLIRKLSF